MAKKALGAKEYKPTRLEWLAVVVNSVLPKPQDSSYYAFCVAGDDEKSIILRIRHNIDLDKEFVDKYANDLKELIVAAAEMYEWDSWLKIETVITAKNCKT